MRDFSKSLSHNSKLAIEIIKLKNALVNLLVWEREQKDPF